ncbi:hypothetical protein EDB85DRAFT_1889454 [Lactarius pseudohatsudake]|nr:hypothetical protein EDB85DRAFT_1889454 [Lactarius pseudohatsudake]
MRRSGTHKADPPPFEPLPDNLFSRQTHPSWHDAYARCVGLFFWAVGRQPPPRTASYDMCSRGLGHLVLEPGPHRARAGLVQTSTRCAEDRRRPRGGLGRGAVGDSSISTPGSDRGARGAALSTYQDERMLASERCMQMRDHGLGALGFCKRRDGTRGRSHWGGGSHIHHPPFGRYPDALPNLLTLHADAADEFRSLNVWLEATRGRFFLMLAASCRQTTVAFSIADPGARPVPSVHYLCVCAACARVAHKSGAAV